MAVEGAGEIVEIKGHAVRLVRLCRRFDHARIFGKLPDQPDLALVGQQMAARGERFAVKSLAGELLPRLPEHRMAARRGVLHVEDRIVLRLLGHLGEVEVERRVVLAIEHHEADRVAPDLLHHLAQRHEVAGALRHPDRLAAAIELDQLADQHGQLDLAVRHGPGQRFQPLDVAAVICAEHEDQLVEAAADLVVDVADVGSEIGEGAVRLDQRPVDVVADLGRAEQRLLAIFPVVRLLALGRRQLALVDVTLQRQIVDRRADLLGIVGVQRALREEDIVMHVEQREILADHRHHRVDRAVLDDGERLVVRLLQQAAAEFCGERLPTGTR